MRIPPVIWNNVREDYIAGYGCLTDVALAHGLKPRSVWRRAARERWTRLRQARAEARLRGILTPPVILPGSDEAKVEEQRRSEMKLRHAQDQLRAIDIILAATKAQHQAVMAHGSKKAGPDHTP